MRRWTFGAAVALTSMVAQPVLASSYLVQPVPVGLETVRFDRGVPTLELDGHDGGVQITPLGLDHGNLVFGVAVYNDGDFPAAFDTDHIRVTSGGMAVRILSPETLVSKEKSRAIWKMVAATAIGGIAAGLSASQTDTYRTRTVSRGRVYRSSYTGPSIAGQVQAQQITAATGVGLGVMATQLDRARVAIGDQAVRLTTIDPRDSYAGKIVLERIKPGALPHRVDVAIDWNGERYPFSFQLARKGTKQPVFAVPTMPSRMTKPALLPVPAAVPVFAAPTAVTVARIATTPLRIMASAATVAPGMPSATYSSTDSYRRALAAEQGVHGRDVAQGWSITD